MNKTDRISEESNLALPLELSSSASPTPQLIASTERIAKAAGRSLQELENPRSNRPLPSMSVIPSLDGARFSAPALAALTPPPAALSLDGLVRREARKSPYPALEVMQLGMKAEQFQTERLERHQEEGKRLTGNSRHLLSINAHLQKASSAEETYELPQEARDLMGQLREKGIDLFPGEEIPTSLSKDRLEKVKSLINSNIDDQKMQLQTLISTKISVIIQLLNTLHDVMKNVAQKDDRLKTTINSRSTGR